MWLIHLLIQNLHMVHSVKSGRDGWMDGWMAHGALLWRNVCFIKRKADCKRFASCLTLHLWPQQTPPHSSTPTGLWNSFWSQQRTKRWGFKCTFRCNGEWFVGVEGLEGAWVVMYSEWDIQCVNMHVWGVTCGHRMGLSTRAPHIDSVCVQWVS